MNRSLVVLMATLVLIPLFLAANPPAAPKVSTFASADDLVKQVQVFVTSFETALASEQAYSEEKLTLLRDAHTLAAVALALSLHDADHALKKSAPGLAQAAQQLARAQDYKPAQEALAGVKKALQGMSGGGIEPTWNQKIGSLGQMMKQVTFVNNRLRRNVRRFDRLADENARDAALLAVLSQAAAFDTHEVKDPNQIPQWYELCGKMRDAAGAAHLAVKAKDEKATLAALAKIAQSCDECHQAFRIETNP